MGPTKTVINHKNLLHNIQLLRSLLGNTEIMAVVKAEAYGHGVNEVTKTLIANGVKYLGVAFAEEGLNLRKSGIPVPILVFGAHLPEYLEEQIYYNLDITLTDEYQIKPILKYCQHYNKEARVHLKFDTGMSRVGFKPENFRDVFNRICDEDRIKITGVYSHFSSADEEDLSYTRHQLEKFMRIREEALKALGAGIKFHIANSAAIMQLPESYLDMVRPGIMIYGYGPGPNFRHNWDLREVMRFESKVTLIKKIDKDQAVSYNRKFIAKEQTFLALVPAGYGDGYNRRLTNQGEVLIRGKRHPIVGAVCMDQFLVNLGPQTEVQIGDEVVLIGQQGDEQITVMELARKLETIPYEITCWVGVRVPRFHEVMT